LPAAKFGNSDSLEVGEWVLAVGNPLELRSTVTAGIISAIGREIDIIDDNFGIENFIQTDAIINPGSSGGALINLKSEVIGINTAIATQSGLFEGYGFAIPANLAKQIVNDLIKAGFVLRSYLGISMQDVTEKIAAALSLENLKGVFVDQVIKDSPAFNAGLHEQDIILKIDGMEVNQGNIIQSVVARKKPGEKLLLAIQRNKQRLTITLKLGRRPSKEFKMSNKMVNKSYSHYGLKVKTIDISLAQELGLEIRNGVLVLEVEKFSPAYEANIRVSDIILEIDAQKVTSQIAFEKIISALKPGKVIIVKLRRNENIFHRFLEIPL
jgi:serine protease Do